MKNNSRTSTSSQALEDSHLQQNGQDSKQFVSVKKNCSVKKSSKNIGQKFQSSQKSETLMEQDTEEQLFLPEVSPANLSPLPASEEARKMTVTSGQKCSELLVKQNPIGYLQRMCLESSAWHSTRCLLIWKGKVTPQGRLLFQLVASMPRIEGTESGLLPTPESKNEIGYQISGGKKWPRLGTKIKMLPTPRHRSYEEYDTRAKRKGHAIAMSYLEAAVDYHGKKTGMKLQPAFVEWMMGFPIGFTDLKHSATQSSHKSHSKLLKTLPK